MSVINDFRIHNNDIFVFNQARYSRPTGGAWGTQGGVRPHFPHVVIGVQKMGYLEEYNIWRVTKMFDILVRQPER